MKKIGFIIADENEFSPIVDFAKKHTYSETTMRNHSCISFSHADKEIIAVHCGIGKVNAATATAFMIADNNVDAIISFGLSGAISGLRKNDIVAGASYMECDFDLTAIGRKLGEKPQDVYRYNADEKLLEAAIKIPGIKKAECGCGDLFLSDKIKKDFFKDTFGINEFDMETGAEASVCHDAGVPFISIRHISDTADDSASDSYTEFNDKCTATLTNVVLKLVELL